MAYWFNLTLLFRKILPLSWQQQPYVSSYLGLQVKRKHRHLRKQAQNLLGICVCEEGGEGIKERWDLSSGMVNIGAFFPEKDLIST